MSERPWIKFYPRDWRGDQALRAVSIAARGLWIECLCIMHEAKPYGHLVLNGNPVDDDTLARMTGVPVDAVSALMTELRQAGVLSVTGKGVVFSRRMTKDHARAHKGRLSAKKRWQQASDGVEQSEAPNRYPNRRPITHIPEARSQRKKDPPSEGPKKVCRGTRLPEDWKPPPSGCPGLTLTPEFLAAEEAKFRDYWRAQPGQRGVKLDWDATWRNWLRRAAERVSGGTGTLPMGVRRNGTGFYVAHDSPEFRRIMADASRRGDQELYWACRKAEREKSEVHVMQLWPRRRDDA